MKWRKFTTKFKRIVRVTFEITWGRFGLCIWRDRPNTDEEKNQGWLL